MPGRGTMLDTFGIGPEGKEALMGERVDTQFPEAPLDESESWISLYGR